MNYYYKYKKYKMKYLALKNINVQKGSAITITSLPASFTFTKSMLLGFDNSYSYFF